MISANAQEQSPKNRFEVNVVKGCAPLTVTATNISGFDPAQFPIVWNMDWDGDETNILVDPNQSADQADTTYSMPGTYKILQVIGNQDKPIDTITIEVMEPLTPRFKVYNCIDNAIYIDFSEEDYYDALIINTGDGKIDTLSTAANDHLIYPYANQGSYTVIVEGLFDGAIQSCNPTDTLITTFDGDEFAKAEINLVRVDGPQSFEIAYDELPANIPYQLEISENGNNTFEKMADLPAVSSSFYLDDPALDTEENFYCFRVVAVNLCNPNENVESNPVCSIALQVTTENLQNRLAWQSEGFISYQLNKNNSQVTSVQTTDYLDTDVVCQEDYAYQMVAEVNGATSISATETVTAISTSISPAPLNLDASLQSTSAMLNWPAVSEASMYYIYRAEDGASSALYDSLPVSSQSAFNYTDPQELTTDVRHCYQISYLDACGNESERSEEACILLPQQAVVVFPNAFTPNSDGLNDTFVYKANLLVRVRFQIFNRWGELIFSTNEIGKGWDGTYRGQPAPQGTYLFVLDVEDELENSFSKSGKFTLLNSMP